MCPFSYTHEYAVAKYCCEIQVWYWKDLSFPRTNLHNLWWNQNDPYKLIHPRRAPSMHHKCTTAFVWILLHIQSISKSNKVCGYVSTRWDMTLWRHQIETLSALLALCTVTGEFPAQRPVTRNFGVCLICAWKNGWVNNRWAVDLRGHHLRFNVTVMLVRWPTWNTARARYQK